MKSKFTYHKIPRSRIATFDVYSVGMLRHHIAALLEFDVTDARQKLRTLKKIGKRVSFNGWLVKVISSAVIQHPEVAAFLCNKKRLVSFHNINISMLVEKEISGSKVPIPMLIENTNIKNIYDITQEIENAKKQAISNDDLVVNRQTKFYERLYYRFPGFLRRTIWRFMLNHPKIAYNKMGNVVITSLNMLGRINGWFIHKSIHPLSFGIGSIIKKPVVIDDDIMIREMMHVTVLIDHDVIDGAPMVRFINDLSRFIESGKEL